MAASYVYDGREWILTGRQAVRKMSRGKEKILIEIQPKEVDNLGNTQYNKWVEQCELYHIVGD